MQSRQQHESSTRHKMNLDKIAKKKKEDEFHGARNEKELRDTIKSIERAAHAAMGAPAKVFHLLTCVVLISMLS